MRKTLPSEAERRQKKRARRVLYASYTLAIVVGLVFLAANVGMAALSASANTWGWLAVFATLSIAHLATPFLPDLMYRIYRDRRFTLRVAASFVCLLLLIWSINVLLLYLFASSIGRL